MTDPTVDKLVALIMAFNEAYPNVPIDYIKEYTRRVGDITTDFALDVTREQILKTIQKYEDN